MRNALRTREKVDVPGGVSVGGTADHLVMRIDDAAEASACIAWIASRYQGPLAALPGS